MSTIASQITGAPIVCWTVCSGADQRNHQSSAPLAFPHGMYRWPVNSLAHRANNTENVSIWWPHHILALYEGNPPVTGGFASQKTVTWSFDVAFDVSLNKLLNKYTRGRGIQMSWSSRNCYVTANDNEKYKFWNRCIENVVWHYGDVIMNAIASQITSLTIVYSIVYSDADQRKHQSSVSLAFVRGIHRGPVNFPHKWPVTRKMFPFDDVIMMCLNAATFIAIVPCFV